MRLLVLDQSGRIGVTALLGHARQRRRRPIDELGGIRAGGVAVALAHHEAADPDDPRRDEELDLEEGALDPDELEGDPLVWDEGADDEVG